MDHGGFCGEQETTFHLTKKPTVEIPPRKLLLNSACNKKQAEAANTMSSEEVKLWNKPKPHDQAENASFYDSDSGDPYATDHFRMYEFKVRRCTRSRSHDWTDCPFAHPGEKARRRDPRRYHYSGEVCPEFRRGGCCSRGDDCEFAHGVFECWLHPSRYRTEACKDGKHCKRKVCFFAHSPRQLRVLPPENNISGVGSPTKVKPACCLFCRSVSGSPTSTLLGLSQFSRSPSVSPPRSPANKAAAMSRLRSGHGVSAYKDMLGELMSSLDAMGLTEGLMSPCSPVSTPVASSRGGICNNKGNVNPPWIDVAFNGDQDFQQLQFALSPSTPTYRKGPSSAAVDLFGERLCASPLRRPSGRVEQEIGGSSGDPDLGWVNDLLM